MAAAHHNDVDLWDVETRDTLLVDEHSRVHQEYLHDALVLGRRMRTRRLELADRGVVLDVLFLGGALVKVCVDMASRVLERAPEHSIPLSVAVAPQLCF